MWAGCDLLDKNSDNEFRAVGGLSGVGFGSAFQTGAAALNIIPARERFNGGHVVRSTMDPVDMNCK